MYRKPGICLSALLLLPVACAAFTVTDVVNAASRIGTGLPSYGIAQGSIFVVTGTGVGQDPPVQASFPLPTSAGLGGVSIKINVGGSSVDAIMVYVAANEVYAILPSQTPLGTGTVTVTNNGATATAPITVVTTAFGIFTSAAGAGPALAFNVAADGTTSANSGAQSAQPGQTVLINGTGLGAIASDETQSGATDVPGTTGITVWVGNQQATVASAGRGVCCDGISAKFPVPQGVAGWDVLSFTVPAGVTGCQVSVVVQIGNVVSNFAWMAISAGGGSCVDLSAIPGPVTTLSGVVKEGLITLLRVKGKSTTPTGTTDTLTDTAGTVFNQVDVGPDPLNVPQQLYAAYLSRSAGSCLVTVSRTVTGPSTGTTPNPNAPVVLDAGPKLTLKGPSVTTAMPKQKGGAYSAATTILNIPLPGGLPPIVSNTGGPAFLDPLTLALDDGSGGADVGPFNINLQNAKPVSWDNVDQIASITRGQPITVKWSGGDPAGYVVIGGIASRTQTPVIYYGQFTCIEHASAGTFTVPGFVTLNFPATDTTSIVPLGSLQVSADNFQFVTIPGVDLSTLYAVASTTKLLNYQ